MQLDDACGTDPWLYVSSVEFARNAGAGAQFMSGTLSTCSNEVQIHCRRFFVLCPTWKPINPSVLRTHASFVLPPSEAGMKMSASTLWNLSLSFSESSTFHETLSMIVPGSPGED